MSRATELAKAEAEDEEAEEAETPAPPAEEPVSEKSLRERNKKLEAEDQRHEKRLHEIYGSTWGDRAMCPLCLQEGFIVPYEPGTFDPQHRELVEAAMGQLEPPAYLEHPTEGRC